MNERITQLAEQAGFGLRRDGEIYTSRLEHLPITEDLAKFAELIVQECADTVTDRCEMRNESDVKRAEYYAKRIKEHFGVEE